MSGPDSGGNNWLGSPAFYGGFLLFASFSGDEWSSVEHFTVTSGIVERLRWLLGGKAGVFSVEVAKSGAPLPHGDAVLHSSASVLSEKGAARPRRELVRPRSGAMRPDFVPLSGREIIFSTCKRSFAACRQGFAVPRRAFVVSRRGDVVQRRGGKVQQRGDFQQKNSACRCGTIGVWEHVQKFVFKDLLK
jgi:hypothetical protein